MFKRIIITLVVFLIIDALWLVVLMPNFYDAQLGGLARRDPDGNLAALPIPAVLVYLIIPIGLAALILPTVLADRRQLWRAALFGLVAYGTYDLTNLSLLKDWPVVMTIVDILWGATVCTLTMAATRIILLRKSSRP